MMNNDIFYIENAHSPIWATADEAAVNLVVKFKGFSHGLPFTASPTDQVSHGIELYERSVSGEFGPIAEYVPSTPVEIAARDNPPARRRAMTLAISQAQHQEMMGNPAMTAAWKTYYQQVYALDASSDWPIVAEWPEVPA